MAAHNELGKQGEELAVIYLQKNGYAILEKNWRYKKAEIDIIAKHNNTLIFVEVKTRETNYFGEPFEAVTSKKEALFNDAAEAYLEEKNLENEVQFDIISIVVSGKSKPLINHITEAF
ncbi:MAG: YraN family protein [Bacteroidota bacterium]